MHKNIVALISICFVFVITLGCSSYGRNHREGEASNYILNGDLVSSGYEIADFLLSQSKVKISQNDPILVATFVNINNLQESSTFGRMLAEYVSSRLSQRGYKVIDMRLRTNSVFIEEGKGEFLLSRDLREVSKKHNAAAVVVGTYGESVNGVYVSVRIINPSDSTIISSCDYGLMMGDRAISTLTRAK
jgi:TolB-like protein